MRNVQFDLTVVDLDDDTDKILEIFKGCKGGDTTDAVLDFTIETRAEGFKSAALEAYEWLTSSMHGLKSICFPAGDLELDPIMHELYVNYCVSLDTIFMKPEEK